MLAQRRRAFTLHFIRCAVVFPFGYSESFGKIVNLIQIYSDASDDNCEKLRDNDKKYVARVGLKINFSCFLVLVSKNNTQLETLLTFTDYLSLFCTDSNDKTNCIIYRSNNARLGKLIVIPKFNFVMFTNLSLPQNVYYGHTLTILEKNRHRHFI